MNSTKTVMMIIGLISGMIFVYSLDILTARFPAELEYHFKSWRVLTYDVKAEIDNLTVLEKEGRMVPVRYKYAEEMELKYYFYHTRRTGKRMVLMELVSNKLTPELIEVAGEDRTSKVGPVFAQDVPAPSFIFLNFEENGLMPCRRRAASIRDMIVSTYHVRKLKKGRSLTGDEWKGEVDMGPFITSYEWTFDSLELNDNGDKFALVEGGGEFLDELPGGKRGGKLGSFAYSYKIGVSPENKKEGYIRYANGSFDINSTYGDYATSYREKFVQKIVSDTSVPRKIQNSFREELANLREVLQYEMAGDTQALHDGLVIHLRAYPESPLWDKILAFLNGLRDKCGEKQLAKNDILKKDEENEE